MKDHSASQIISEINKGQDPRKILERIKRTKAITKDGLESILAIAADKKMADNSEMGEVILKTVEKIEKNFPQ